ncbi:unnamed protein product [Psylliodes chrysocephalus]|uniref:Uncharacterized protein n=1 Tax=Psylliodes chrysocephalus TaxID=3402493 RepID=A0A9P0CZK6_9CUCU|nr:unnamed protein product [Psylliodes chrysocephala]
MDIITTSNTLSVVPSESDNSFSLLDSATSVNMESTMEPPPSTSDSSSVVYNVIFNEEPNNELKEAYEVSSQRQMSFCGKSYLENNLALHTYNLDLKRYLEQTVHGQYILQMFQKEKKLNKKCRDLLVDILINGAIQQGTSLLPTDFQLLSEKICQLFSNESKDTYYIPRVTLKRTLKNKAINPKGKLIDKYRNLKKKLCIKDGKENESQKASADLTSDVTDSLEWLKNWSEPWDLVLGHWKKTFPLRRMSTVVTVQHFLEEWTILKNKKSFELTNFVDSRRSIELTLLSTLIPPRGRIKGWKPSIVESTESIINQLVFSCRILANKNLSRHLEYGSENISFSNLCKEYIFFLTSYGQEVAENSFAAKKFETVSLNTHLHAYEIQDMDELFVCKYLELNNIKPLFFHTVASAIKKNQLKQDELKKKQELLDLKLALQLEEIGDEFESNEFGSSLHESARSNMEDWIGEDIPTNSDNSEAVTGINCHISTNKNVLLKILPVYIYYSLIDQNLATTLGIVVSFTIAGINESTSFQLRHVQTTRLSSPSQTIDVDKLKNGYPNISEPSASTIGNSSDKAESIQRSPIRFPSRSVQISEELTFLNPRKEKLREINNALKFENKALKRNNQVLLNKCDNLEKKLQEKLEDTITLEQYKTCRDLSCERDINFNTFCLIGKSTGVDSW